MSASDLLSLNTRDYPLLHPLRLLSEGGTLFSIEKGEGIYIFDQDGKRYIDGISGLWNTPFGHANSKINEAISKQLNLIAYVNTYQFSNSTTVQFCKSLLSIVPDIYNKVILSCLGSETIEIAIKICRKYYKILGKHQKNSFIVLDLSYHGTTFAAMSASGIDRAYSADYEPKVPGFIFFKTPFHRDNSNEVHLTEALHSLEELFHKNSDSLAGIIIEPILGSGGIIPLPEAFIVRIKELCEQYDVLLVFDEVATGFGRTGALFAFNHYNIIPDIICLSKGINNGYLPLAANVIHQKIETILSDTNSTIEHFSTQNGNPLACAAGIATIDLLKEHSVVELVSEKGIRLKSELLFVLKDHPNFYNIRGCGLMIGVNLVKDKKQYKTLSSAELMNIVNQLFRKGLVVYPFFLDDVISGFSIFPPLIITEEQINRIVQIIERTFVRLYIGAI